MDSGGGTSTSSNLTWTNVALAFSFVAFDAVVSTGLGLGVGGSLISAALRCIVQLSIVAVILGKVFESDSPWITALIAVLLNTLGTIEAVVNKSKKRYHNIFPTVFVGLLGSTIPVSIIGTRFAMSKDPFWVPAQYIPIVGMLCGNTVSGVVVSITYVLKELTENKDKVETYLAFGASRFEASKPIARAALSLALTPTINQMSVMGIIAIPGLMTGAILGGSPVEQAAKLQMILMFMISASSALASIVTVVLCLSVVIDKEHRIRTDLIDSRVHPIYRARNWVVDRIKEKLKHGWKGIKNKLSGSKETSGSGERQPLLGNGN